MRTAAIDFDHLEESYNFYGPRFLEQLKDNQARKLKAAPRPVKQPLRPSELKLDRSRDDLLSAFGQAVLKDRYLLEGESFQDMFARVSCAYADDLDHAQRLYDYMSQLWFMPATPVLSNGGAKRGLPISCFLNSVEDSLQGIVKTWDENVWLASQGGGIGTYWGEVRSVGEPVKRAGKTSGIIPFLRVMDSLTLAISQGSLRRGSAAVYLDVHHPEIEEFLEIRKPSGDFNRKCLNIHHGVNLTDAFMEAVKTGDEFPLVSPKSGEVVRKVNARALYQKILETRLATGEPYIVHIDKVNDAMPKHQKDLGLKVKMSNLCSEIFLPTGIDHHGEDRTAVCCLSSMNAETYEEWKDNPQIFVDIFRFLDNVLQHFIDHAPSEMDRARYSAERERSVGLGLMGFHSALQKKGIPFESALAKSFNLNIFKTMRKAADEASFVLAKEKGPCLDAKEAGAMERFSHKLAIAPTASISIICGETSACIEPIPANVYTHKTLSGSFSVKNKHLKKLLKKKDQDTEATWQSIIEHQGSVQHLDFLSAYEKDTFKTAFEIDQRWVIEFAADRAPSICQGQSINVFLPADIDKWDLLMLHYTAWQKGVKSLYYCRSKSMQRAEYAGQKTSDHVDTKQITSTNYEECLSCQ
jgi:ribonucleoside-diphosphate reductase alpha chain